MNFIATLTPTERTVAGVLAVILIVAFIANAVRTLDRRWLERDARPYRQAHPNGPGAYVLGSGEWQTDPATERRERLARIYAVYREAAIEAGYIVEDDDGSE